MNERLLKRLASVDAMRARLKADRQAISAEVRRLGDDAPDALFDASAALEDEDSALFDEQWELRKALKLDPRTGLKKVKAPPMQTVDEGWFPEMLVPLSEWRQFAHRADIRQIRNSNLSIIAHEACDLFHLIRYVTGGVAVAGLSLYASARMRDGKRHAVIDTVFTAPEHRRMGYAKRLIEYARTYFSKVAHSKTLTAMGRDWKGAVKNPRPVENEDRKVDFMAKRNPFRYPIAGDIAKPMMIRNPADAFGVPDEAHLVPTHPRKRKSTGPSITSPDVLAQYVYDLELSPVERFLVALLDTQNRILGIVLVSQGTLNSTEASPREVFAPAIAARAAAIILIHNHPSGATKPSREDIAATVRMVKAGSLIGIPVLDHMVMGRGGAFTSLAQIGEMGERASPDDWRKTATSFGPEDL